MTFVYILRCADNTLYIGHTDDLETRISHHHYGTYGGYTARRRPLTLSFCEEFSTREDALTRERQLKGWSRAKKEALARRDWHEVSPLSHTSKADACPSTSSGRTEEDSSVRADFKERS